MTEALEQEPAETNLSEDLSAAWDSLEEDTPQEDATEEQEDADTAPTGDEDEASDADVTDDTETKEEVVSDDDSEEEPEEESVEGLVAPEHWSKADREMFDGLDDAAKEFVNRRYSSMEKDYHSKTQKAASSIKFTDSVKEMLDPFRERMNLAGIDDISAIQKLVAAQALLERDPRAGIEHLANAYNVDLDDVDVEIDEVDPQIAKLEEKIRLLEGNQTNASLEAHNIAIEQFRDAKGSKGEVLHPYFDEVYDDMVTLVKSQVAGDIDTAYQKAIWANESVRAKMLESVQAKTKKAISTANAEKAAKAKRAALANRKGTGDAQVDTGKDLTLMEELEKNYDSM